MKHNNSLLITLIVIVHTFLHVHAESVCLKNIENNPLIVTVLMVKNEGPVIQQTLQPLVDGGVKDFFIFDTGSDDDTLEKTSDFFKKYDHCTFHIEQEPFIDFATSRNRALELAEQKFPYAAFILMPDAEWYLHNVEELIDFCKKDLQRIAGGENNRPPTCLVRIMHPQLDFYTPRLIRCRSGVKFVGVVHEVPIPAANYRVSPEVYFELGVSRAGYDKSRKRWYRDRDLLQKSFDEDPTSSRTAFYLAQTYECLGDIENAYKYYALRAAMRGWDEEDFVTVYRLARIVDQLAKKDSGHTWEEARLLYERAYRMRTNRIEPLVNIAQHYIEQNDHEFAFMYSQRAAQKPYPQNDVLFVEKDKYDYERYNLLGWSAWWVNEFGIGEQAVREALKSRPNMRHLEKNLAFYLGKKIALQLPHDN